MQELVTGSSTQPGPKAAELLARRIEREIVDAGWPVGEVFGYEPELTERYGVSRSVLREAIRILEHHYVARARRGRGGGLVVTEPEYSTVTQAMKLYLQYQRTTADDIHNARMLAELACVELAAKELTEERAAELREVVALEKARLGEDPVTHMHDFHTVIGRISGNPVLDLNVRSMSALLQEWYGDTGDDMQDDARAAHRAHAAIAEAVLARDVDTAVRRMQRHLEALAPYVRSTSTRASRKRTASRARR